jgi:hypothetical protein
MQLQNKVAAFSLVIDIFLPRDSSPPLLSTDVQKYRAPLLSRDSDSIWQN